MNSKYSNKGIVNYPQTILRKRTRPVHAVDEKVLSIIREMVDVMLKAQGVGLSANQIGYDLRIFIASPRSKRDGIYTFINPRIISKSGTQTDQEGCLSVPGLGAFVKRYNKVEVEALDIEGKKFKLETEGLMARIVQHELDHLNGRIFIQRLPYKERKRYLRSILKGDR
jgi:peptide deformylase